MSNPRNKPVLDFLLTKRSVHNEKMLYDVVNDVIDDTVEKIKKDNLNAKITNVFLCEDNQLGPVIN